MKDAKLSRIPVLIVGLLAVASGSVGAQLRPLEPVEWSVLDDARWTVQAGGGIYDGQRASLAGTEGQLWELGTLRGAWRLGRVAFQVSGTAYRVFRDETVFADPLGGARAPDGRNRHDTGDYLVSTLIRLTSEGRPFDALLRFGTRLPTTDNRVGLERDRTDFFSTLAARYRSGPLFLTAEAGIGIMGTRDDRLEQVDPLLYALSAGYRIGPVTPVVEMVGQHDTRTGSALRGTEDLSELRLGLRTHGSRWLKLTLVRGFAEFSPDYGLTLQVGFSG